MTPAHSPWPLFSDDLDFAQSWMREQLKLFPMSVEAGHIALNIGLRDEVEGTLRFSRREIVTNEAATINSGSAWLAWMAQRTPTENSYPVVTTTMFAALLQGAAQNQTPLAVHLIGGLGDQLEMLNLVLPWGKRHSVPLRLIAEEQRCKLLNPLLPNHATIEPFDPDTCSPFSQAMAIRLGVLEHDPQAASHRGFRQRRTFPIRTEWCVAGERRDKEVSCQRTADLCLFL